MLSSTHLSSFGGAVDEHMVKVHGLTATGGHTVNNDVLLLGDEFLDDIYPISIYICGGKGNRETYSIRNVAMSFVRHLMIS